MFDIMRVLVCHPGKFCVTQPDPEEEMLSVLLGAAKSLFQQPLSAPITTPDEWDIMVRQVTYFTLDYSLRLDRKVIFAGEYSESCIGYKGI
jgi:hypothetical protein